MLLSIASPCSCGPERSDRGGRWGQELEHFAGEVALEAADDLALGQALGGATLDVGDGRLVPAHPYHDCAKQCRVRLAVTAAAPQLVAAFGIGPDIAAELLVAAASNAAQAVISLKLVSGSSWARSSSLAVTSVALRVIIAWLWALTAVSRATLTNRSVSMSPSPVLGIAVAVPASTWRAACSASMVSLLPAARRSALRGGRLTSITVRPWRRRNRASPTP